MLIFIQFKDNNVMSYFIQFSPAHNYSFNCNKHVINYLAANVPAKTRMCHHMQLLHYMMTSRKDWSHYLSSLSQIRHMATKKMCSTIFQKLVRPAHRQSPRPRGQKVEGGSLLPELQHMALGSSTCMLRSCN